MINSSVRTYKQISSFFSFTEFSLLLPIYIYIYIFLTVYEGINHSNWSISGYFIHLFMSPTISFVTSNKGKPLLAYVWYLFRMSNVTVKAKSWSCQECTCSATVHSNSDNQFIKSKRNHGIHLSSPEEVEWRMCKNIVEKIVTEELNPIGLIYDQELANSNFFLNLIYTENKKGFAVFNEFETFFWLCIVLRNHQFLMMVS